MTRVVLNSQSIPAGVVQSSDLEYPLTNFSSTGIDDNASNTAITINANGSITIAQDILNYVTEAPSDSEQYARINGTWAQVAGGIEYTVSTSNVTATADQGIIADTSAGSFTITLPASPSAGDKVFIADGGDWSNNNLTVARNGSTIEDANTDFTMDYGGVNVGFIYDGSTWQVYPQAGLLGLRGIDDNALSTAITIAANNNVGIGETSPSYLLDLKGGTNSSIRLNALSGAFIFANGSGLDKGSIAMSGGNMNISADAGINFYSAGSPLSGNSQVVISTDGRLGVGVSAPESSLHVDTAIRVDGTSPTLQIQESDTTDTNYQIRVINGGLAFQTNNDAFDSANTQVTINSGGNVGIGTTNPSTVFSGKALQVSSDTGAEVIVHRNDTGVLDGDYIGGFLFYNGDTSGNQPHYAGIIGKARSIYGPTDLEFYAGRESLENYANTSTAPHMVIAAHTDEIPFVGINTATPSGLLDVAVGSASAPTYVGDIRVKGGSATAKGGIEIRNTTFSSGYGWRIDGPDEGGGSTPLVFRSRSNSAAWTERVRFLAGGGIAFNGDTTAANALDDYEEGTWTPVLTYGGGNTGQVMTTNVEGNYVKIGSLVTANIRWTQSTKGTSTGAVALSLPFAVANVFTTSALEAQGSISYYQSVTVTHISLHVTAWHSSSTVQFYYRISDTSNSMNSLTDAHVGDGFDGRLTVTYRTN